METKNCIFRKPNPDEKNCVGKFACDLVIFKEFKEKILHENSLSESMRQQELDPSDDWLSDCPTVCLPWLSGWLNDRLSDCSTVPPYGTVLPSHCLAARLFYCRTVWLSDSVSDCLTVWLSNCLTVRLSDCLTIRLSDCPTVCLPY